MWLVLLIKMKKMEWSSKQEVDGQHVITFLFPNESYDDEIFVKNLIS